jgi:CubicO group peptidase (beta-lactamase class C family)
LADIDNNRPIGAHTTMMIYSMSKTITALAIHQLIENGKIALADPAIKYLPDIPYGDQVTIRHLLSQTSGIPNPIPLKWVHLVEEHSTFDEYSSLQKVLSENPKLDFIPGKKYRYSNISYWLLGRIIEKASGYPFEDYIRQNVFRRLNIPENEADFMIPSPANHSKGYIPRWSFMNLLKSFFIDGKFIGEYENHWLHINDHYLNGPPFGGIVCSAHAIGIFLQDQLRDSSVLFGKKTKDMFFEQQMDNDGNQIEMTLGWHISTLNNIRFFYKEGGGAGFHSEMRIYPQRRNATVVIANNGSFDLKALLNTIDKEFIE